MLCTFTQRFFHILRLFGEMKTKPTQHSVKELRGLGIQPNMLVIRTEKPAGQNIKNKLAQFCDVAPEAVIESLDVDHIYQIPLNMQAQNMDQIVCDHLKLDVPKADMSEWSAMVDKIMNLKNQLRLLLLVNMSNCQMLTFQLLKLLNTQVMLMIRLLTLNGLMPTILQLTMLKKCLVMLMVSSSQVDLVNVVQKVKLKQSAMRVKRHANAWYLSWYAIDLCGICSQRIELGRCKFS